MYKKFFIGIIVVAFMVSMLPILLSYLLSNKNIWADTTPAITLTKHRELAEKIDSPKILVIGGSSTLFGIDSELIYKNLNYHVVNLGSFASLRLEYILYDAKKSIKNNDIVILPLEYGIYYNDMFSEGRIIQIWQNDKEYFDKISFVEKIRLLYSIPFNIEGKVLGIYMGMKEKQDIPLEYNSINKNGDSVNTLETKEKVVNIKEPFDERIIYLDTKTKETIIDFLNYCKEKNVKVFITYPSYYYKQKYFDGYNLEQINKINNFWQEQDVIILGQYTDFIYTDKNNFYDTEYHLNIKGREKRTEKLIELLKPYINNN